MPSCIHVVTYSLVTYSVDFAKLILTTLRWRHRVHAAAVQESFDRRAAVACGGGLTRRGRKQSPGGAWTG